MGKAEFLVVSKSCKPYDEVAVRAGGGAYASRSARLTIFVLNGIVLEFDRSEECGHFSVGIYQLCLPI